jgi:CheY-like chemotaxis protein
VRKRLEKLAPCTRALAPSWPYTSLMSAAARRVLLVTEGAARSEVPEALSGLDLGFVTADGPVEAARVLRDGTVDLVILDVAMPHVNGWEVVRRLSRTAPVFVLTAADDDHIKGGVRVLRSRVAIREACVHFLNRSRTPEIVAQPDPREDVDDEALAHAKATANVFASAVTEAIATHHREGREVVVERDGKIVRLAPPRSGK